MCSKLVIMIFPKAHEGHKSYKLGVRVGTYGHEPLPKSVHFGSNKLAH